MLFYAILGSFILFLFYTLGFTFALSIILIVVGGLMTLVYFNQNKLLYMPGTSLSYQAIPNMPLSPSQNPPGYRHPTEEGLPTIDLELKTEDGLTIRGWHVQTENAHQVIIYFHQNAGNIGFRIPLIKELRNKTQSQVILVAYRGYSDSDGFPTEKGLQKDAQAIMKYAVQYAESKESQMDVFLYGRSLGGAVSIYLGSHSEFKSKVRGLILENTFTSISDMIDAIMPVFKYIKFLQTNYWRSIERVPQIEKPILFIRSLRDELVPTSQMVRLLQSVDEGVYVEEHQIEFGTHNSSWELNRKEYFGKLNSFIRHPKVSNRVNAGVNAEMENACADPSDEEGDLLGDL